MSLITLPANSIVIVPWIGPPTSLATASWFTTTNLAFIFTTSPNRAGYISNNPASNQNLTPFKTLVATPTGALPGGYIFVTKASFQLDSSLIGTPISIAAPSITSFTPTSIQPGSLLRITGTELTTTAYVLVGGISAVISSITATGIDVTVPLPAASGITTLVVVTKGGYAVAAGPTLLNQAPTVTISGPTIGTVGTNLGFQATATDSDGVITKVELLQMADDTAFVDFMVLDTDVSSPYGLSWTPTSAGHFALRARATDNAGASSFSSVLAVTVQASVSTPRGYQSTYSAGYPAPA